MDNIRNLKNENMYFKSSSNDNNKKHNLSSSLTMNAKTIYNQRLGKNKVNNHKSNKKDNYKILKKYINNNNIHALNSNFAQLYIKNNNLKNYFDYGNYPINNHTI